jgi:hypothetical protein
MAVSEVLPDSYCPLGAKLELGLYLLLHHVKKKTRAIKIHPIAKVPVKGNIRNIIH